MDTEALQGTDEWRKARCGSLGASQVADATARIKSGWGASRRNVMAQLVVERLTGNPTEGYVSKEMQWGTDNEPAARSEYEFQKDAEVALVGVVPHPRIARTHASPDGLVSADGLVEIKCPNTATHLETLLSRAAPGEYFKQMQWQMACTGRLWCDFVSFDPRLPQKLRMFCVRVPRDDTMVGVLEAQIEEFLSELDAKLADLDRLYGAAA